MRSWFAELGGVTGGTWKSKVERVYLVKVRESSVLRFGGDLGGG